MAAQVVSLPLRVLLSSHCTRCGGIHAVQRITPSRAGFEQWTLRCAKCGELHHMQVVSDLTQSDPVDWFDNPLTPPA